MRISATPKERTIISRILLFLTILASKSNQKIFIYNQVHFPQVAHVTSYIPSTKEFIASRLRSVDFYNSKTGEKTRSLELKEPGGDHFRTLIYNAKYNFLLICDRAPYLFKVDLSDPTNQVRMLIKAGERFYSTIPLSQDSNLLIVGSQRSRIWKFDMALQTLDLASELVFFPAANKQKQINNITLIPDTPYIIPSSRFWDFPYPFLVDHTTMSKITGFFTKTYVGLVPSFNKQRLFLVSFYNQLAFYNVPDIAQNKRAKEVVIEFGGVADTSTSLAEMTSMRWLVIFLRKAHRFFIFDEVLNLKFDIGSGIEMSVPAVYNSMFVSPIHPTLIISFQKLYQFKHNVFALPELCDERCKQGDQFTMCERQIYQGSRSCNQCFKGTYLFRGECIETCPPGRAVNDYVNECQGCDFYHILDHETQTCKKCQKGQFPDHKLNKCVECSVCCGVCGKASLNPKILCQAVKKDFVYEMDQCKNISLRGSPGYYADEYIKVEWISRKDLKFKITTRRPVLTMNMYDQVNIKIRRLKKREYYFEVRKIADSSGKEYEVTLIVYPQSYHLDITITVGDVLERDGFLEYPILRKIFKTTKLPANGFGILRRGLMNFIRKIAYFLVDYQLLVTLLLGPHFAVLFLTLSSLRLASMFPFRLPLDLVSFLRNFVNKEQGFFLSFLTNWMVYEGKVGRAAGVYEPQNDYFRVESNFKRSSLPRIFLRSGLLLSLYFLLKKQKQRADSRTRENKQLGKKEQFTKIAKTGLVNALISINYIELPSDLMSLVLSLGLSNERITLTTALFMILDLILLGVFHYKMFKYCLSVNSESKEQIGRDPSKLLGSALRKILIFRSQNPAIIYEEGSTLPATSLQIISFFVRLMLILVLRGRNSITFGLVSIVINLILAVNQFKALRNESFSRWILLFKLNLIFEHSFFILLSLKPLLYHDSEGDSLFCSGAVFLIFSWVISSLATSVILALKGKCSKSSIPRSLNGTKMMANLKTKAKQKEEEQENLETSRKLQDEEKEENHEESDEKVKVKKSSMNHPKLGKRDKMRTHRLRSANKRIPLKFKMDEEFTIYEEDGEDEAEKSKDEIRPPNQEIGNVGLKRGLRKFWRKEKKNAKKVESVSPEKVHEAGVEDELFFV